MKRSLLIGGLIAGAFLLPTVASAKVAGNCVTCHTMHNSQDGAAIVTTGAQDYLLNKADCAGCHLGAAATLRLDDAGQVRNGGYFNTADDTMLHNVSDGALVSGIDNNMTGNTPGTATAYAQISCSSCHTATGHHGSTSSYRLLGSLAGDDSVQGTKYGLSGTTFPATRAQVSYPAGTMDTFCAGCHGGFHGSTNQGGATPFIRHPTSILVFGSADGSINAAFTGNDSTPLNDANGVMCLSCHVPHGGPYADLLAFNYAKMNAGNATNNGGCENCHSNATWGF